MTNPITELAREHAYPLIIRTVEHEGKTVTILPVLHHPAFFTQHEQFFQQLPAISDAIAIESYKLIHTIDLPPEEDPPAEFFKSLAALYTSQGKPIYDIDSGCYNDRSPLFLKETIYDFIMHHTQDGKLLDDLLTQAMTAEDTYIPDATNVLARYATDPRHGPSVNGIERKYGVIPALLKYNQSDYRELRMASGTLAVLAHEKEVERFVVSTGAEHAFGIEHYLAHPRIRHIKKKIYGRSAYEKKNQYHAIRFASENGVLNPAEIF